jgi:hypothetical protein
MPSAYMGREGKAPLNPCHSRRQRDGGSTDPGMPIEPETHYEIEVRFQSRRPTTVEHAVSLPQLTLVWPVNTVT